MSGYTVGEIVVWLVLAALLGGVLGWLLRTLAYRAKRAPRTESGPVAEIARSRRDGEAETEPVVRPGSFPGSALPLEGGAAPGPEWTVKGNSRSMVYHVEHGRFFGRTTPEVWFRTEADAVAAGFRASKT